MSERIVLAEIKLAGYVHCSGVLLYNIRLENPIKGTRYLIGERLEESIQRCGKESDDHDVVWILSITRILTDKLESRSIDVEPIEWHDKNFQRILHSVYHPRHMIEELRNDSEN